jgi:hypothetical protein
MISYKIGITSQEKKNMDIEWKWKQRMKGRLHQPGKPNTKVGKCVVVSKTSHMKR